MKLWVQLTMPQQHASCSSTHPTHQQWSKHEKDGHITQGIFFQTARIGSVQNAQRRCWKDNDVHQGRALVRQVRGSRSTHRQQGGRAVKHGRRCYCAIDETAVVGRFFRVGATFKIVVRVEQISGSVKGQDDDEAQQERGGQ